MGVFGGGGGGGGGSPVGRLIFFVRVTLKR